ncbi:nodulation protein S (NodS) [Novosphingobium sp. PhB55]|uniref:SAM-dependent methyltransferase n=1 Tax=Novosphingobium sp. PhB55 TaxID=2485106 RepID=UPI0010668B39|nr:SAM-dependent methyltransferase [Novosphingobium sp. PhB55]TDW61544.1 nodulation protein S (NodS) [Novosphingobium sp. PhB55]
MTRHSRSLEADYFEQMFEGTDDPWDLETSPYEQAKFAETVRALGGRSYEQGLEIGCAKGVLTQLLAPHCKKLLAVDVSVKALKAAKLRLEPQPNVEFERMAFPGEAPENAFELVVLSEVVYYWDDGDLALAATWIASHLEPGGDLLLVHWTGETDYPQTGDEAAEKLLSTLAGEGNVIGEADREKYRLDLWRKSV